MAFNPFDRSNTVQRYLVLVTLLLVMGLAIGCTKSRNDAQIASEVQSKVMSDPNVPSRQISIQAQNGVVTLAGNVTSDQERAAAANAAGQVEGVKTVVNNLQVSPAANMPAPDMNTQAQQQSEPQAQVRSAPQASRPTSQRATTTRGSGRSTVPDYSSAPIARNEAPVAPRAPVRVTIPDGTTIAVRLIDGLDSERSQTGDSFRATLSSPIVVNDEVVLPADSDVEGRVVDAKSAGRFAGSSGLTLELNKISVNGRTYQIRTNQWSKVGNSRGKNTAAKVGGGAALGAIIGGIAGGGKGAAIGAGVGAGAGTGVQAATHGQQIKLNSEALLTFQLESPITVTPATQANRSRRND